MTDPAPTRRSSDPQRLGKRLAVFVGIPMVLLLLTLSAGLWWGHSNGYVPDWRQGCTDEGYPSPMPSYAELVNEWGKDPYCAREARGEAWF